MVNDRLYAADHNINRILEIVVAGNGDVSISNIARIPFDTVPLIEFGDALYGTSEYRLVSISGFPNDAVATRTNIGGYINNPNFYVTNLFIA